MRLVIDPGVDTAQFGEHDELSASYPLRREVAGARKRRSWKDQGRYADGSENVAHVEFHRGTEGRQGSTGTDAPPHVPDKPVAEVIIRGDLRGPLAGEIVEVGPLAPARAHTSETLSPLLLGRRPRVVG